MTDQSQTNDQNILFPTLQILYHNCSQISHLDEY